MDSLNESLCLEEFVAGCEATTHTQLTNMTVRTLEPAGPGVTTAKDHSDTTVLGAATPSKPVPQPTTSDSEHPSAVGRVADGSSIKTEGRGT